VVRGKHGAEGRDDAVEARLRDRQLLRIPLEPFHLDARLRRPAPGVHEQLGGDVDPGDPRTPERRLDRDVAAVPGSDVEQGDPRLERDPVEDERTNRSDQPREAVPVAGRPGGARPLPGLVVAFHEATVTDLRSRRRSLGSRLRPEIQAATSSSDTRSIASERLAPPSLTRKAATEPAARITAPTYTATLIPCVKVCALR